MVHNFNLLLCKAASLVLHCQRKLGWLTDHICQSLHLWKGGLAWKRFFKLFSTFWTWRHEPQSQHSLPKADAEENFWWRRRVQRMTQDNPWGPREESLPACQWTAFSIQRCWVGADCQAGGFSLPHSLGALQGPGQPLHKTLWPTGPSGHELGCSLCLPGFYPPDTSYS